MVIRVRILDEQQEQGSAIKRRRDENGAMGRAADLFTDIAAHANVLCSQSPYFDRCLGGDWAESVEGRVDVTVPNEQAAEDFRTLIKLCYSDSFAYDKDQLLPWGTRMRLGVLADAYEFVDALQQLVESLPVNLDFQAAFYCLDDLPAPFENHPSMAAVRRQVVAVLVNGIKDRLSIIEVLDTDDDTDEETDKQEQQNETELRLGANALAELLGPVAAMVTEGPLFPMVDVCEEVKNLPLSVFKMLLASDALQVQLENDAYILLVSWIMKTPCIDDHRDRIAAFKELVPLLRFNHMTLDFLANVVSHCEFIEDSEMLVPVMSSALVQRNVPSSLLSRSNVGTGKKDRGYRLGDARWHINASFTLEEVSRLEPMESIVKWCGPVAGYSAAFEVGKTDEDLLDFFVRIQIPGPSNFNFTGSPYRGVGLTIHILVPNSHMTFTHFFTRCKRTRTRLFDNKTWTDALSQHFPQGKMEIKATVKLVIDDDV